MTLDTTPKSWFSNVVEGDTLVTPYTFLGESKGQAPVTKVEISFDAGDNWLETNLNSKTNEWSFELASPMPSGESYKILTRAYDKAGRIEKTVNPNLHNRYAKRPVGVTIVDRGLADK